MAIGSFGDFVFGVDVFFNSLDEQRQSRIFSHATVEGLPVVEFAGVDSDRITLSGVLTGETAGDLDDIIIQLRELQDGVARPLTRGSRCYGSFIVESLNINESHWAGDVLAAATWQMSLISQR